MNAFWYIRRLQAMSAAEVVYRVTQKTLQCEERKAFRAKAPVHEVAAYGCSPKADLSFLGLNLANDNFSIGTKIELLGGFAYSEYRKRWHAAFQSESDWPVCFAFDYAFDGDGAVGDIRTNWELSRHRQFVILAKSYFVSGRQFYLDELIDLFDDWNAKNPFLWGVEWFSPMEESIRLINWLFAAAFLEASDGEEAAGLCKKLCHGAWIMAECVRRHYSRYSSANNHTIVEAAGVGIVALVFGEQAWLSESVALLEREVTRQTYADGVNKEQALHYQLFVMEALCLFAHVLKASGKELSGVLVSRLRSMADYVRACRVDGDRCIGFGDDDEGVILCLSSTKHSYSDYVLAFTSLEVGGDKRWAEETPPCETIRWLYSNEAIRNIIAAEPIKLGLVEHFPEGGVTILRSADAGVVLVFDHGSLGLAPLAAHGHADALSVQLCVEGEFVLIDPGTYVYNGNREMRDLFRSTKMHNTVCVGGRNQSEILGPFLWGRKAEVLSVELAGGGGCSRVSASHNGYAPAIVKRTIEFTSDRIVITDELDGRSFGEAISYLHLPIPGLRAEGGVVEFTLAGGGHVRIVTDPSMKARPFEWSPSYGTLSAGTEFATPFEDTLTTIITITRSGRCAAPSR